MQPPITRTYVQDHTGNFTPTAVLTRFICTQASYVQADLTCREIIRNTAKQSSACSQKMSTSESNNRMRTSQSPASKWFPIVPVDRISQTFSCTYPISSKWGQ